MVKYIVQWNPMSELGPPAVWGDMRNAQFATMAEADAHMLSCRQMYTPPLQASAYRVRIVQPA